MSPAWWGGVLGAVGAAGLLLSVSRVVALRRTTLALRVLPYVRDVPRRGGARPVRVAAAHRPAAGVVFGPLLRSAADAVEAVLGGSGSVRRRLERAGFDKTVHELRIEQVLWGMVGFAVAAGYSLLRAIGGGAGVGSSLILSCLGFVAGVVLRDNHLSTQV